MSNLASAFTPISGNLTISGTILTSGSINASGFSITASAFQGPVVSASYAGTASILLGSISSASFASNALSASYAGTASILLGSIQSASYALTASFATTASAATSITFTPATASFALTILPVVTASYAVNAGAANNASFAPNGFTITGSLNVSGNINDTGYQITASFFKGDGTQIINVVSTSFAQNALTANSTTTSTSASFATTASAATSITFTPISASYALTASFALNAGQSSAGSNTGSFTGSFTGAFQGNGAGITGVITSSYATNAGTAQNANYAPAGFTITGSLNVSGNINNVGYVHSASFFSGSIASASFASSSYSALTASAATSLTFVPVTSSYAITSSFAATTANVISASYAGTASILLGSIQSASYALTSSFASTASFATIAQTLLGSITSASYAATASYATPQFIVSGNLFVTGAFGLTSQTVTASLQIVSNTGPNISSGSYIELFDSVTNMDDRKGNINLWAGLPSSIITSGALQAGINFYTSGALQWRIGPSGNLDGISQSNLKMTGSITASGFSGNGAAITGVISSSYAVSSSYALVAQTLLGSITSASFATTASYANTASFAATASAATSLTFVPTTASFALATTSASFAQNALTANNATSASYALTASAATSITFKSITGSFSGTLSLSALFYGPTTTAYTASGIDAKIFADTRSGSFTIILPDSGLSGRLLIVKPFATASVTLLGSGSQTFNSSASFTLSAATSSIELTSKGTGAGWTVVAGTGDAAGFLQLVSASFAQNSINAVNATSASFATTASAATSITFTPVTASYALTASVALNAGPAISASYALTSSFASTAQTLLGSVVSASYAGTASVLLGSIQSASFATTASAATSLTFVPATASFAITASAINFTVTSASYATNAGAANNASFAPNGFTITGSLNVSGNANYTGYAITASNFLGTLVGSASYATNAGNANTATSASFATTASAATSITFTPVTASYALTASVALNAGPTVSASYATTASYASVAQTLLGSITSASYAATASYATPSFVVSSSLTVCGSLAFNSVVASASLQLLSNNAPTYLSGAFIELFDAVTNMGDKKGNVNIWAALPNNLVLSGSNQGGINFYTSGTLQWRIGTDGNLKGFTSNSLNIPGGFISASFLSGSGANITGVVSSSYALTASFALNGGQAGPATSASYAATASVGAPNFAVGVGAFFTAAPNTEALVVDNGAGTGFNIATFKDTNNNYSQVNVLNRSNGVGASSDLVATNDSASETGNFIDVGINSTGYTGSAIVGLANDAYVYNSGSNLYIGNATPAANIKYINFFNGGNNADSFIKMRIHPEAGIGASITGSLLINGITSASSLYISPSTSFNAYIGADIEIAHQYVTRQSLGTLSGNVTASVTMSKGQWVEATASAGANIKWAVQGDIHDRWDGFVLTYTSGGAATNTWMGVAGTTDWPGGTTPTLTPSGGQDVLVFTTEKNNGWRGVVSQFNSK